MDSVRRRVDTGFTTSLSRRAGGAFLGLAGLVNLFVAARLYGALGSEPATLAFLSLLESHWSESTLLARGETVSLLVGTVAPAAVVLAVAIGLVQCVAAVLAAAGRAYWLSLGAAVVGTVTVVAIPLCVAAGILCWCSRDHFDADSSLGTAVTGLATR